MLSPVDIETKMDYYKYIEDVVKTITALKESMITANDMGDFKDVFEYHKLMKGKAIRPALCMLFTDTLGGNRQEAAYFGLGVEMVHNGSLFQDDVLDNDVIRRGVMTVHERFGIGKAILSGDLLAAFGFDAILNIFSLQHAVRGGKEYVRAINRLAKGALLEHTTTSIGQLMDENLYFTMLGHKTAALYSISARLGAIASDSDDATEQRAALFGESVGLAFQLTDDVVDIVKSMKAKSPVGDVKEGKVSLPIIHVYKHRPDMRSVIERYVKQRGTKGEKDKSKLSPFSEEDFHSLMKAIVDTKAFDYAEEKVTYFVMQSKQQCLELPRNDFTAALYNFAEFACNALRKEM